MIDGVDAQFGTGAVARSPGGAQKPANDSLVGVDDVQAGGLGDDGVDGAGDAAAQVVLDQPLHAEKGGFLINRAGQDDALPAALLADQLGQRRAAWRPCRP